MAEKLHLPPSNAFVLVNQQFVVGINSFVTSSNWGNYLLHTVSALWPGELWHLDSEEQGNERFQTGRTCWNG